MCRRTGTNPPARETLRRSNKDWAKFLKCYRTWLGRQTVYEGPGTRPSQSQGGNTAQAIVAGDEARYDTPCGAIVFPSGEVA